MLDHVSPPDDLRRASTATALGDREFLSFADIAAFLRRYLRTIAICIIAATAVMAYLAFTATPIYTARAQVLIDPRITQIQREQLGELTMPLDTAQMESQLTLLRSEGIGKTVVTTLELTKDPEFQPKRSLGFLSWFRRASPPATIGDYELHEAILRFQAGLDATRVGISYGIEIGFSSSDPEKAARIANTIALVYVNDQLETRRAAAQAGSIWLEEKISLLRRKMNAAARTAQEFKASRDYRLSPQMDRSAESSGSQSSREPVQSSKEFGITLEELESTAQTYRKLYESYLQAYTEALQRDSYPVSNARVISKALPPVAKSYPKTHLMLTLGVLVGALAGIGISLLHNTMGNGVHLPNAMTVKKSVRTLRSFARRRRISLQALTGRQPHVGHAASPAE